MTSAKTRALIVGGGFGGVKVALELAKDERFDVTLISNTPNFRFFPSLYHTATGGAMAESCIPLKTIFADKDVMLVEDTAVTLDRQHKAIQTEGHKSYPYDVLVLALGSMPNYFGIKGIEEFSYNIKTPEEAKRFKTHLHEQLTNDHRPDLNYAIVGGGPTGIELASSLPGYLKQIMKAHGIKHKAIHVDLIEAAPKLLPSMPKAMSRAIARRMRHLGVRLYIGKAVQGESADSLMVDGKPIQSHTVVWAAGIANHPFFANNGFSLNDRHKVVVDEFLQTEPDIYVLGDNAGTQYSGMAQTALYDAVFVCTNIIRKQNQESLHHYVPQKPIYVIPAGPYWAAVLWGKVQLYGKAGWVLRSLADLRAFADYEPWFKAGKQWMTEFESEEDCPVCTKYAMN